MMAKTGIHRGNERNLDCHKEDDMGWQHRIAEEHDANDNVTKRFNSRGMQVMSGTNAVNYFYAADHLGSIRELTSLSGAVQTRYDYDPYGRRTTTRVSEL